MQESGIKMKIDNINNIPNYNAITADKTVKKSANGEVIPYSADKVDIGTRTSVEDAASSIKDNILNVEKKGASSEKLEALKKKISQGEYKVDTKDIVKSIL